MKQKKRKEKFGKLNQMEFNLTTNNGNPKKQKNTNNN